MKMKLGCCDSREKKLKGRIASPGRIDQPNDALSLAACVKERICGAKKIRKQKSGSEEKNCGAGGKFGRINRQNDA
jgi:hypothetical protein